MSRGYSRRFFEVVFLGILCVTTAISIGLVNKAYAFHLPDETAGHSTPGPGGGGSTAPSPVGPGGGATTPSPAGPGGGSTAAGPTNPPGTPFTVELKNPLKVNSIEALLKALIDILLIFAVPIIVFFLILSGFKFVMARGNESEISAAKMMFTWTVVGGVLILGAWALVAVIQGTVNALR